VTKAKIDYSKVLGLLTAIIYVIAEIIKKWNG
jgi:hypothetical protein